MKSPKWFPRTVSEALDPAETAILFWDLQNGLGGYASNVDELAKQWTTLRKAAQKAGVFVLVSRHVAPRPELMDGADLWRISRRAHGANMPEDYMQEGSEAVQFLEGFEPQESDLVIQKRTPSLFVGTEAEARLHARGIRNIVMAGVATNVGIDVTVRHALCLGFFPVVVEDAVGAFTPEKHTQAMALMSHWAFVADTSTVVSHWEG
jgi:nicotinamidase-related amidase